MTATEMHRVCGTDDVVVPVLEHRENCLCSKAWRAQPAEMVNERDWVFDSLGMDILDALDKRLTEAGSPMIRTVTRRYNAAGASIGPNLRIRRCDALLFWRVLDHVFVVLERGAERQR
jgi:hypothetical protein